MGDKVILFVGPLPPPLHGFSFINGQMLARWQALAAAVRVFNRAPPPGAGAARRLLAQAVLLLRYGVTLLSMPRRSALYIGLSGGLGQLLDLPFLLAARLMARPVLVHHHSFAYLRGRPWPARWVLAASRAARHITLCDCMADALVRQHRIPRAQVTVVSNAAFLPADAALPARPGSAEVLRLGFLSNITAEKGIFAFLELGNMLVAQGVPVQGLVAGPVPPELAPRLQQALAQAPWARHLGAVYGADKDKFYAALDVLVFPTFYANEAEPVTLLEAMRAGLPVLANARGCIADLVPAAAGTVLRDDAQFVPLAGAELQAWQAAGAPAWQARGAAARAHFVALQAEHSQRLAALLQQVAGPAPAKGMA